RGGGGSHRRCETEGARGRPGSEPLGARRPHAPSVSPLRADPPPPNSSVQGRNAQSRFGDSGGGASPGAGAGAALGSRDSAGGAGTASGSGSGSALTLK